MKKLTSLLLCMVLVLSLCSVTAFAAGDTYLEAACTVDPSAGTVELVLKAAQPLTNATIHVAYDSDYLTYLDALTAGTVNSVKAGDQMVTVGMAVASDNVIAAGGTAAVLRFGLTGGWDETDLTVTVENWNGSIGLNESLKVPVEGTGYRFEDVLANQWFFEAVDHMADEGIIKGISAARFAPDLQMNRAMFVTLLGRLEGVEASKTETRFTDVVVNSYYSGYVAWAEEKDIVRGIGGNLFAPEMAVTREQMVVFLYRYAAYKGMDVTVENPAAVLEGFSDGDQIGNFATDAVIWAVDRGIIKGITDSTLEPKSGSTRAQVAVMLYRFFYESPV